MTCHFRRHSLIQHNFFHEIQTPTENKHSNFYWNRTVVLSQSLGYLWLTRQIYSEGTNGAHAHNRDRVPLIRNCQCIL